ncbi:MAG: nitrous oxide-stimulated promoter family protein [Christensenellales bacterium]|jgi:hypothetical protein
MTQYKKRVHEKKLLSEMIAVYCRGNRHGAADLCDDCRALRDYALKRSDNCRHMETKTFCSNCETPCYNPNMRASIRAVMRYSGPRMLLRHPIILIKHVYYGIRGDKK